MTDLNLAGESYAHSLIAAGKVDRSAPWSFEAADGNALLGKGGDDWEAYGKAHLGLDRSANDKTKGRYKYPLAKAGKLYRSALIAIRSRAGQQSDAAIEKAAGALLDAVDKPKAAPPALECKAAAFEYKFVDEGSATGTFEGYGSVFGNEDSYGDVIAPGAFLGSLAEHKSRATMPKMLLNHGGMASMFGGMDPMADVPIGKWTAMSEDSCGLQTKGRLINLDTERGKTVYGAMKEGELGGLSIGYRAKEFTRGTKPSEPARTLKAVDLIEVSPVTFPANDMARIGAVKSARDIETIREFEDFLRDVGRFSHASAKAIAAGGFKALQPDPRDEDGIGEAIAGPIARLAKLIRSA